MWTSPAIGNDGTIYVGWAIRPNTLPRLAFIAILAVEPDGNLLWRYDSPDLKESAYQQQPIVGPDGTVYISLGKSLGSAILAFDGRTGVVKWRFTSPIDDYFARGPVLTPDGRVLLYSEGAGDPSCLYCVDAATGSLLWSKIAPRRLAPVLPAVDSEGCAYVSDYPDRSWLSKLSPSGETLWSIQPSIWSASVPAAILGPTLLIMTPTSESEILRVDRLTGAVQGAFPLGRLVSAPSFDFAGNIFATDPNTFFALRSDGTPLWELPHAGSDPVAAIVGSEYTIIARTTNPLHELLVLTTVAPIADVNCDGSVNGFDVDPFVLAVSDPEAFADAYPACDIHAADTNQDGSIDGHDVERFVTRLTRP